MKLKNVLIFTFKNALHLGCDAGGFHHQYNPAAFRRIKHRTG